MGMLRVMVVDDHPLVREGLKRLLSGAGIQVAWEAGTAREALRTLRRASPDLVLWDWALPDGGLPPLRELLGRGLKVLVLTAFPDHRLVKCLRELGVRGFVAKTASPREIVAAVREAASGGEVFPATPPLTEREEEILKLLAKGLRNVEIAEELGISVKTVENHLERLKAKIGCCTTAALRAWALERF